VKGVGVATAGLPVRDGRQDVLPWTAVLKRSMLFADPHSRTPISVIGPPLKSVTPFVLVTWFRVRPWKCLDSRCAGGCSKLILMCTYPTFLLTIKLAGTVELTNRV
jgi:hypothetical protein